MLITIHDYTILVNWPCCLFTLMSYWMLSIHLLATVYGNLFARDKIESLLASLRYRLLHSDQSCQEKCKSHLGMPQYSDSRSSCSSDAKANRKWKHCGARTWLESAEVGAEVCQCHIGTGNQAGHPCEQCGHCRFHLLSLLAYQMLMMNCVLENYNPCNGSFSVN